MSLTFMSFYSSYYYFYYNRLWQIIFLVRKVELTTNINSAKLVENLMSTQTPSGVMTIQH